MRRGLNDAEILAHLRQIIMILDEAANILHVTGASMGLIGHDPKDLIGKNALDYVTPAHLEPMIFIFAGPGDHVVQDQHAAFQLGLLDIDGNEVLVECAAERVLKDDEVNWVVTLMPNELRSASFHATTLHSRGASSLDVANTIADHLAWQFDAASEVRSFVLSCTSGLSFDVVAEPRSSDRPPGLLEALRGDVAEPAPWNEDQDEPYIVVDVDQLPRATAAAARELGFVVACIAIAHGQDPQWSQRIGFVSFGRHAHAFTGNVEVIIDESMRLVHLAFDRERSNEALRAAAERDALTGLSNRHVFDTKLALHQSEQTDVAVVYIDLDGFKSINDTYGHSVGDAVLTEVADRISEFSRPDDVAARLGGDEFVVLLVGTSATDAAELGNKMLGRIIEPLGLESGPTAVSATGGLAVSADGNDIVERADLAMLEAKRAGHSGLVVA